ncbi:MAG: dihydrofolate reductase family protein, partial [Kiloniellales bacterium]
RLRLPLSHDLVVRAPAQPTLLITGSGPGSAGPGSAGGFAEARGRAEASADTKRRRAYEAAGVEVATVGLDAAGVLSLSETLKLLGGRGLTRLLVEGGGQVAASLLRDGLVDRLVWFRAPGVIGGDGLAAVAGLAVAGLTETPRFRRLDIAAVGEDMMETYTRLS